MDEQAKKLFASLVFVVNNLKNPQALTKVLKALSTRHVKYGVLPEHYPMVVSTLLKAMAATLQDYWTPALADAWTEAYSAITEIMLEGTDKASYEGSKSSQTPNGAVNARQLLARSVGSC